MTTAPITVVVVDDHVLIRYGLREILQTQPDVAVVGEAGDSASAIDVVTRLQPSVVVLDVEIPGGDATDTVRMLRQCAPNTQVVILSMYDGPHLLQRLLALGIRGYLLKSVSRTEFLAAIRNACGDSGHVTLSVSRRSLAPTPTVRAELSRRELDVLTLAARAMSNAQIAARLYLTEATVKRHLSNIFAKLGAVSRLDAVNKAIAANFVPPPLRPTGVRPL
jgi:DNA-binding NarL/FixJ family response regulator